MLLWAKLTSAVDIDNTKKDLQLESALMTAAHILLRLTKEGKSYANNKGGF